MTARRARRPGAIIAILIVAACTPRIQPPGTEPGPPRVEDGIFIGSDGGRLPLRIWDPESCAESAEEPVRLNAWAVKAGLPVTATCRPIVAEPSPYAGKSREKPLRAAVVGLHGLNDYSNAFDLAARWWAARGVMTYAPDQRGFGATDHRGIWAGADVLARDAAELLDVVRARHPDTPTYFVGVSMGGAIAMTALIRDPPPKASGAILVGPAVWGRETMPAIQRWLLRFMAHTVPSMHLTGSGLNIKPSDNRAMLRALGQDPLVIKYTRVDTVWGLVNLMDAALDAAPEIPAPLLVLYGDRDELVPKKPTIEMIRRLPLRESGAHRIAVYPDSFHMLLRGLEAERVWRDMAAWFKDPNATLPSGADRRGDPVEILSK